MLFVADLVTGLESPTIAPTRQLDTSSAVHYAIYDQGRICRLVLLNTAFYDGSGERLSHHFNAGSLLGAQHLRFRRLTGRTSAATNGITWAGQSVDNETGDIVGEEKIEEVGDGVVTLLASEGAVVELCE